MTTITDSIKNVAEALGWLTNPRDMFGDLFYAISLPDDVPGSFNDREWDEPYFLLQFQSYIVSEMAKRGWVASVEGNTCSCYVTLWDEYGEIASGTGVGSCTKGHEFNPKDAVDTANAYIRAVHEALGI